MYLTYFQQLFKKMPSKKLSKIYKSNELNQSNFNDYELSIYRVLLNIMTKIKHRDQDGLPIKNIAENRIYSLSADEYAQEFNLSKSVAYRTLQKAVKKLVKSTILLPKTLNGKVGISEITVCSEAFYEENSGKIDIEFSEKIMPHLIKLNNKFTMYNLCEITGFNSIYTTRLYELLMQYKTTGKLDISVEKLRYSLGCIETKNLYADFKRSGFGHAISEINSNYEININFKEIKKGKSVDRIVFSFKKAELTQVYDSVTKKIRNQLTRPKKKKVENNEISGVSSAREAFTELANKLRVKEK